MSRNTPKKGIKMRSVLDTAKQQQQNTECRKMLQNERKANKNETKASKQIISAFLTQTHTYTYVYLN